MGFSLDLLRLYVIIMYGIHAVRGSFANRLHSGEIRRAAAQSQRRHAGPGGHAPSPRGAQGRTGAAGDGRVHRHARRAPRHAGRLRRPRRRPPPRRRSERRRRPRRGRCRARRPHTPRPRPIPRHPAPNQK
ncbi:MAG: hypothetical protein GC159_02540 [Phycisphaera sp.]|nr:hypothetical protein [Phycisphaera sp.]